MDMSGSCVCVKDSEQKSLHTTIGNKESQDGNVCEFAHTACCGFVVNYTTTILVQSASRVVSSSTSLLADLLADIEVVR